MFELSDIRAFNITQRRVSVNQADITEIIQRGKVFLLTTLIKKNKQGYSVNCEDHPEAIGGVTASIISLKPPPAESQCAKSFIDVVEQSFRFRHAERDVRGIELLHVVRALEIFHDVATTSRSESLDGVKLVFLHASALSSLDDRYALAGVNLIGTDRMATEVSTALNWVCLPIDLDLVRLHDLFNRFADL